MSTAIAAVFVIALIAGVVVLLERTNRRGRPRFPLGGEADPQLRHTWVHLSQRR